MSDRLLERLGRADPARGASPDKTAMDALLVRLLAAAPGERPPRRRLRVLVPIAVAALVLAVAGLAAGHRIIFGAPAKSGGIFSDAHRGLGKVVPGSLRLLAVSTPDPVGGPPWGMRIFQTTRGEGCVQVARLVDGKLGALGRDRAFHNDGRFHPLAVGSLRLGPATCVPLDANRRTFMNGGVGAVPASATQSCWSPEFTTGAPARLLCKPGEERALYFGLLGPDAVSVTYRFGRQLYTRPTVGPEGAYLIVAPRVDPHGSGGGDGLAVPFDGPIVRVSYRDGSSCTPKRRWGRARHHRACIPQGYAAPHATLPTPAQVAAPILTRLVHHGREIELRFTARVAITSTGSSYGAWWRTPHIHRGTSRGTFTQEDIAAGQTVTLDISARRPGLYIGRVEFSSSTGGDLVPPGQGILVGRFAVRVR